MRFALGLVVCLAAVPGQERASRVPPEARPGRVETPHLTVAVAADPIAVGADGKVTLYIDVTPKPKMHVYAPEETRYLPVSLRVEPVPGVTAAAPVFPKGERFYFAPLEETQLVFSQPFRIAQPLALRGSTGSAPVEIRGTLRYQACDDRVCYLPREIPLRWTLAPR